MKKENLIITFLVANFLLIGVTLFFTVRNSKRIEDYSLEHVDKRIIQNKKKVSEYKNKANEKKKNLNNINVPTDEFKLDSMFESNPNLQRFYR